MKLKAFHIVLSFLLTIAVNDYIWIDLLHDDFTAIEVETEEKEGREELRENKLEEVKHDAFDGGWALFNNSLSFQNIASGIVKHGNSFCPLIKNNSLKLFILHCQLRLDC